jgi:diguanylate cyclase (GGDEF)-like protein
VALIDLDDFKEVNDTLGHEIGDVLLIAVAQRLAGVLRQEDMVARLGGDEFVVVIDDADPAAADLAAGRMKDALAAPVLADGHELPIRASIGIADGRTGDEASTLLRHADIAMYAAKNIPGTAHLHYSGEMRSSATDSAHLGAELRTAIDRGELFLLYQPIVSLESGRVLGAEALVRWEHPVQGTLAPDAFIPVAERTGLIVPLGRWVMRTAFQQMASWAAEHGGDAPRMLNVNISARDLREPGFVAAVRGLLTEYDLDGERITLEITETMALEPGQSVTTLHELRALGIRVSLDDFGTGHSPLTLLHDVPVDEVKLDRSFTQTDTGGQASIAAAVIHLAPGAGSARGRRGRGDAGADRAAARPRLRRGAGLPLRPPDAGGQLQRGDHFDDHGLTTGGRLREGRRPSIDGRRRSYGEVCRLAIRTPSPPTCTGARPTSTTGSGRPIPRRSSTIWSTGCGRLRAPTCSIWRAGPARWRSRSRRTSAWSSPSTRSRTWCGSSPADPPRSGPLSPLPRTWSWIRGASS